MPLCKTVLTLTVSLMVIQWCLGMLYAAGAGMISQFAADYRDPSAYGHVFAQYESAIALMCIISKSNHKKQPIISSIICSGRSSDGEISHANVRFYLANVYSRSCGHALHKRFHSYGVHHIA